MDCAGGLLSVFTYPNCQVPLGDLGCLYYLSLKPTPGGPFATRANVVAPLRKRKKIPRRAVVVHGDVKICAGGQQTGMPGRGADFGQCPVPRERMADERVPPVVQGERP